METTCFVVVDNYSCWPEVILLKKTDASHVTRAMEGISQTHSIPESVCTDNGLSFSSVKEFPTGHRVMVKLRAVTRLY